MTKRKDDDRPTLGGFLEGARQNEVQQLRSPLGQRLGEIHTLLAESGQILQKGPHPFVPFFVHRAHAAFLAACRLALSGQGPEPFRPMRGALESIMYANHIAMYPESWETWIRRDEDPARMKSEFSIRSVKDSLRKISPDVAGRVDVLYTDTIEYGAHPNPDGILTGAERKPKGDTKTEKAFVTNYLDPGSPINRLAVKHTARVGVVTLEVVQAMVPERFKILGYDLRLDRLRQGL